MVVSGGADRPVSRRVVGWAMSARIDQQLVLDALNMALLQRRVKPGLIHHTDQGRHTLARPI